MNRAISLRAVFLGFLLCLRPAGAEPLLTFTLGKPDGIYQPGEPITWHLALRRDLIPTVKQADYILKKGGAEVIGQGRVDFQAGRAVIQTVLDTPGTILADATVKQADGLVSHTLAGAAVAPDGIPVSARCPADFDRFWNAKLAELAAVPEHPVLTSISAGKPGVIYAQVTLDNIRGTRIRGQLARPDHGRKFPALLIVQWAGLYPLQKAWVTDRAAEGWLTLNISAHDLPIDRPAAYYEALSAGALTNYPAIGNADREQSYFLRMYLSCYRAVEYLAEQPGWDGRTLVVGGTSQGGLQSFVAAALNPKVTAIMALVPAGCDDTGDRAGRNPGWPYWLANAGTNDLNRVRAAARYYDGVNFAARVHCPALIGLGLIDTTSPPSGVFAAVNQLRGRKEIVVMPQSNHHGDNNTQDDYKIREAAWRTSLLHGGNPCRP